jgi:hypothetical protein
MKSKVAKIELENTDLKKRVQKTEEKLNGIMQMLRESLKQSIRIRGSQNQVIRNRF